MRIAMRQQHDVAGVQPDRLVALSAQPAAAATNDVHRRVLVSIDRDSPRSDELARAAYVGCEIGEVQDVGEDIHDSVTASRKRGAKYRPFTIHCPYAADARQRN